MPPVHIPCVATVIAPRPGTDLAPALATLAAVLPEAGSPAILAADEAADVPFAGDPARFADLRAACLRRLGGPALDLVLQPQAARRKRLLLADMDSTMIGQECVDELADHVGLKPLVAAITERAMRGELAFEPALRERVALLKGLPVAAIDRVLAERITLTPGGPTLVRTMRAHGAACVLVSGGFTLFTRPIGERIGFDESRGNVLVTEGERLAGRVAEPILGREAKLATLREFRERLGLAQAETLAIGDGANDLGMIEEAGLGVAFHAKPAVASAADARLDHCDLGAVLFLQGFRRDAFIAP